LLTDFYFQEGIISDGDGEYLPGVDNCVWIIAPQGADRIYLEFRFFDMSPDYHYNIVNVDVCQDVFCTSSSPLKGSPFMQTPGASPFRDIATASTGFVRVSFPAIWSGHTQARFVLYYSTDVSRNSVPSGLITGSWHYVSAVVESVNQSSFSASIYVNGTLFVGPAYSLMEASSGLAFAGHSGIALGRSYPMSAPFGYFMGFVDELLVIDRVILGYEVLSVMNMSCSKVPQTIMCFSFDRATVSMNGSIYDGGSGWPSKAVSVSQDRFQPWCITRNDGGALSAYYTSYLLPFATSWGFCTSKARLPGVDFDYDAQTLNLLTKTIENKNHEFSLKNLPGCSNIPLIVSNNTAGRYVYKFIREKNK
jgi:hypothetical protein